MSFPTNGPSTRGRGHYNCILHVSSSVVFVIAHYCLPFSRECTWHLQPDHGSSPHSLQLGLWVHQAALRPWKKEEPQLHGVHSVSAGTRLDSELMSCMLRCWNITSVREILSQFANNYIDTVQRYQIYPWAPVNHTNEYVISIRPSCIYYGLSSRGLQVSGAYACWH